MKKSEFFLSENFHFLVVKFSVYLKSHVYVMLFFSVAIKKYLHVLVHNFLHVYFMLRNKQFK